ncbi:hypothetical protein ABVT39_014263 [Epinephelus coioides]
MMIGSLATALEFNAAEVKECKSEVAELEEKMVVLEKENTVLKERSSEHDRYSRRWNLRVKGMKEMENENTGEEVINLLKKTASPWAQKMDDIVDTVHRLGRKEEKRTRQVIIQFVKLQHRDGSDAWRREESGRQSSGADRRCKDQEILVVRLLQHGGILFQVRGNSAREASATKNVYTCYRTEEAAAAAQRVQLPARQ